MEVYIGGKRIKISPAQSVAKGGEADIFKLQGGLALKLFKPPDHPDLAGDFPAQKAAERRIQEHQRKLPDFPDHLPHYVVTPEELAVDRKRKILGYTMQFIEGAEVLLRYGDKGFRQAGISNGDVAALFRNLHETLEGLHKAGVIVGDLNDLNVLVKEHGAYFIDADSYQFGRYPCRVYTEKFLDPLLVDPGSNMIVPARPYNEEADWYAFCLMLMQSLLFVGPYGGVYQPKDRNKRIPHNVRPLHRITVFVAEVKYPKVALHYKVLPDDLLDYLFDVFKRDKRGAFPTALLDMDWKTCEVCGLVHARPVCPDCAVPAPAVVVQTVRVRGAVTCTRIFKTRGIILFAAARKDKLLYLYWENNEFKR